MIASYIVLGVVALCLIAWFCSIESETRVAVLVAIGLTAYAVAVIALVVIAVFSVVQDRTMWDVFING